MSEFGVVYNSLLQHCRATGYDVGDAADGGIAGTPRACREPTHPEFNSFRNADVEQMWLCLGGARIPALCQRLPGKEGRSTSQNSGCAKLLWGVSKHTHKHLVLLRCWHWSMHEAAAGLPHVPTMCTTSLLCVFSFRPGSLEQNTKCNG